MNEDKIDLSAFNPTDRPDLVDSPIDGSVQLSEFERDLVVIILQGVDTYEIGDDHFIVSQTKTAGIRPNTKETRTRTPTIYSYTGLVFHLKTI